MEEHMATKAVTLAQKSGSDAEVLLPHTSADLVGYEKENSTATNVKEALDEMFDNFQGEKPGIVQRVEDLEEKVQPFTAPTASAAGTEGLVPAPEATPLQVQPLRVMGPNAAWNVLRQGSFDVSWDEADSKKIVLGAKYVQAGTSVDAIPYAGDFYCDAWNVPGISEALTGVLIRRDPGTYGMEEESVRSSFEILYDLSFDAIRFRKTTGGFAAGGAYTWSDWDTLLEKSSAAPVPTASDGVGQWIALQATSSGFAALPQGGTWACYFSGNGPLTGAAKAGGVVILPGGSTPSFGTYQWGSYNDVAPEAVLAWRIA